MFSFNYNNSQNLTSSSLHCAITMSCSVSPIFHCFYRVVKNITEILHLQGNKPISQWEILVIAWKYQSLLGIKINGPPNTPIPCNKSYPNIPAMSIVSSSQFLWVRITMILFIVKISEVREIG